MKSPIAPITKSLSLGTICAILIFVVELSLGATYAEVHARTFIFFAMLYVVAGVTGGLLLGLALNFCKGWLGHQWWRSERVTFLPAIFLFAYFFIYGFYYINEKLTPAVGMFAPLSLFADLVYLGFGVMLFRLALSATVESRSAFVIFLQVALLPLLLLVAVNLRYFAWQPPVMRNGELVIGVLSLGFAGVFGAIISKVILSKLGRGKGGGLPVMANIVVGAGILFFFMRAGAPSSASFYQSEAGVTSTSRAPRPRNIIWIVTDTARRDHVSVYGGERDATPNLKKFSEETLVFDRAIATAPWTLPSHASMFTGMYPSKHGAHYEGDALFSTPLLPENLTIAEILSSQGYQTAGIAANNAGLSRALGCNQGFQYYFDAPPFVFSLFWGKLLQRFSEDFRVDNLFVNEVCLASEINPIVYNWLEKRDPTRPFFLFINYMEPHGGIAFVPEPYDSMYGFDREIQPEVFKDFDADEIIHFNGSVKEKHRAFWNGYVQRKIAFMDYHLGDLFDRLKNMGLYDDAMLIVNSDHGELFGEHNSFGHNTDLYNELIWVPMMLRYPQAEQRGRSDRLVQTVDIMPEILTHIGVEIADDVQGQPFAEIKHEIVAELFQQKHNAHAKRYPERYYRDLKTIFSTANSDSLKYIWSSDDKSELFDLDRDPSELSNVIAGRRSQTDTLHNKLHRWQLSFTPLQVTDQSSDKDKEELEKRLRSLGYIK